MNIEEKFIQAVKSGKNCLLTGGGGVGKTYLVNKMREALPQKRIAMTATTGLAALHIKGTTINSFLNFGTRTNVSQIRDIMRNHETWWKTFERLSDNDIILIDEVSMMASDLTDLIDLIMKKSLENELPFGGKQMIFVGDFLQLPPVISEKARKKELGSNIWAFQSEAWKNADIKIFHLTEVKRQSDVKVIHALNEIRFGSCGPMTKALFNTRENAPIESKGIIRLLSKNDEVDEINEKHLHQLEGPFESYKGIYSYNPKITCGREKARLYYTMKQSCNAEEIVEIKKNARLILLKNNPEEGYVNGSMGTYRGRIFTLPHESKLKKYQEAVYQFERFGINHVIDERNNVILLNPLEVEKMNQYRQFDDFNPAECLVIDLDDTKGHIYLKRASYSFKSGDYRDENEEVEEDVVFHQFPIRLAWAITIHKSQGMTLDNVEIYMDNIFSEAQAYVALSRVKSLEGMRLIGWNPNKVKANKTAIEFYRHIEQGGS
jgi:ATP-dependent DNA helicase PIF1